MSIAGPEWAGGPGADIDEPSVARMYDYYLGGCHNLRVDRAAARAAIATAPHIVTTAHANRAFLHRVVCFAADTGIDQYLDLGSGLLTAGSVHEVARQRDPDARIVCVEHDPMVVAHSQALLADDWHATILGADIRHLPHILDQITAERLLDLDRPIAVLALSVAHFVPGDIPQLLAPLHRLTPASLLAISHATKPDPDPGGLDLLGQAYAATGSGIYPRTENQITAMFTGFPLVAATPDQPNTTRRLVAVDAWRPDPAESSPPVPGLLAGVGIRPAPTPPPPLAVDNPAGRP